MDVVDKYTRDMSRGRLHPTPLVSFCIPGAPLVHVSPPPYGFDSQAGSGMALDVLSCVLRGGEL